MEEFETEGPGVEGIDAEEAIERLRVQESEFAIIENKHAKLNSGEVLFGMPKTEHEGLNSTRKQLKLYKQLYDLYENVVATEEEYRNIYWADVVNNIETMMNQARSTLISLYVPSNDRPFAAGERVPAAMQSDA